MSLHSGWSSLLTVLEPAKDPGFISVFESFGVILQPGASKDASSIKVEGRGAVVAGQLWSGFSTSTHKCTRHAQQVCDPGYRVHHLPGPLV